MNEIELLEKMASEKFSSADGNELDFFALTGGNDDLLDFEGTEMDSFAGSGSEKQFSIVADSDNTAKVLRFYLFAGYKERQSEKITIPLQITTAAVTNVTATQNVVFRSIVKAQGVMTDGYTKDIDGFGVEGAAAGNTGPLTISSNEGKSVEELQEYLKLHPSKVIAIQITSDSDLQVKQSLVVRRLNPFKETETRIIRPSNFQDQDTIQSKTVVFPVDNLQIDALTEVLYSVVPSATVNINLIFGASASLSAALKKKADRAKNAIKVMGGTSRLKQTAAANRLGRGY